MYSNKTDKILNSLGYESLLDFAFDVEKKTLEWYHSDTKPSEQFILDNELNVEKINCLLEVKAASSRQREKYASNTVGKANAYASKALEAYAYYNLGAYDGAIGGYMQARMNETGETATSITDEWIYKSKAWQETSLSVNPYLEAKEDKARIDINLATTVSDVEVIRDAIIVSIKLV